MGGTPIFGGSWDPILQLDLENWIVLLRVLNLSCHILDFVPGLYFPDDPLKNGSKMKKNQKMDVMKGIFVLF